MLGSNSNFYRNRSIIQMHIFLSFATWLWSSVRGAWFRSFSLGISMISFICWTDLITSTDRIISNRSYLLCFSSFRVGLNGIMVDRSGRMMMTSSMKKMMSRMMIRSFWYQFVYQFYINSFYSSSPYSSYFIYYNSFIIKPSDF